MKSVFIWVIQWQSLLFGGYNYYAKATIPPPPPLPQQPPPPPPPHSTTSDDISHHPMSSSSTEQRERERESSTVLGDDSRGWGSDSATDVSSSYSEQIMTRQQAEQFVLGDHHPPPPHPHYGEAVKSQEKKEYAIEDDGIQYDQVLREEEQEEKEVKEQDHSEGKSWIVRPRPPPPPPHLQFQRQREKVDFLQPQPQPQQRLHQPPPPPQPPRLEGVGPQSSSIQSRPLPQQQQQQQQQRILHPLPPSHPRRTTFPQGQPYHGKRPLSASAQASHLDPNSGALVPHRARPALQGFGKSILDKFGKSLDAISDVDTILSNRAQQVMRTVATSSDNIAESVSGAMRKTVFSSIDGVTGIKESIKDQVRGRVSSIFGGAPTTATEARDEWEDDRRRTVSENRRKRILGTERGRGSASSSGETYTGSGESPLQQHLYGLMQQQQQQQGVESEDKGEDDSSSKQAHELSIDDSQGRQRGHGQGQGQVQGMHPQPFKQGTLSVQEGQTQGGGVANEKGFLGNVEMVEKRYGESIPKPDVNPYAMLAYPASMQVHDDDHEDESSDVEDYGDTVDPSTFFVATPSSTSDYKRQASPASFDIEDDGRLTIVQRAKNICRLPSLKLFALLGKSKRLGDFDDSAWSDDDWASDTFKRPIDARKHRSHLTTTTKSSLKTKSPVDDILGRFHSSSPVARKSTTNLLSSEDMHQLGTLGRSMGFTDFMALSFMYLFIEACVKALGGAFSSQQWLIPQTPDEVIMTFRQILSTIAVADVDIFHTWAPFAFIAYVLSVLTRKLIFELKSDKLLSSISEMIKAALENSQLFLRLASGAPFRHNLTTTFANAVQSQSLATLEIARLRTFVFLTVCTILASSVAIVKPICTRIVMAAVKILSLEEVREWPIEWSILGGELKDILMTLGHDLRQLLAMEVQTIMSNPLGSILLVSVLSTLLLLSQLSVVERRRSKFLSTIEEKSTKSDKMDAYDLHTRNVEKISNLGVSSANRLRIQMENGAIERILLHESASLTSRPKCSDTVPVKRSIVLRKVAFAVICGALVTLPVGVYVIISLFADVPLDSRQLVNICLMLLFAYFLTTRALFAAVDSSREICHIAPFLRNLSNTMNEVNFINQVTSGSSVSSQNKGVEISNLWAAHARKRAWACRGVNITCRAGEVVAVLGDESCGKTRLLATIGESLAMPPKRSRTTTIARGNISIGGIETQKWNIVELRRKIGVMLNDARTLSDMSQLFSGLSLYDILRPTCPIGTHEGAVKSAVDLAIEFTGISKSLLPRLPTKLNTLVTANEDDMTNSNQNVVILSASEWSKVLLTKLIAQIILTNDNPMSATTSITRSLLGSVLLLDDVTNHLNEIEEIKLIKTLRHSGAATLMTSKRWTIGRFATRIVVLLNGSVVESGTHAELIARGADNSLYAARWAQMMSS